MITYSLEVTQELVFILFLYYFPLPFFFNQYCLHFTHGDTEAQRRKGQPKDTGLGSGGFGTRSHVFRLCSVFFLWPQATTQWIPLLKEAAGSSLS